MRLRSTLPVPVAAPEGEVYFVADAHLCSKSPEPARRFHAFLDGIPGGCLALLGDTIHVYWGPEVLREPLLQPLFAGLREFSGRGRVYYVRGNRDFLAGPELCTRAGVAAVGDAFLFRRGTATILASHGDELCLDDVLYQRMRRLIRSAPALALWWRLPAFARRHLAQGLHSATRRELLRGPEEAVVPSRAALRALFAGGADAVVSGHRHRRSSARYVVGGREFRHHELPRWSEEGVFGLWRHGAFSFCRYEGEGGVRAQEVP